VVFKAREGHCDILPGGSGQPQLARWLLKQRQRKKAGTLSQERVERLHIGAREFARLIKAAGVKRIKFHGMRHTVATLMLSAGVPAHVVQRRLGHSKIEMTLGIYAHALPTMQQDAASRLAALLHANR
jgi:integrase